MNLLGKKGEKNGKLFVLLSVFLFYIFYISYSGIWKDAKSSEARKGIFNYQLLTFSKKGETMLKGEWEFYWKHLYFPEDFINTNGYVLPGREFVPFPKPWNQISSREDRTSTNSPFGYATYRLRIKGLFRGVKYSLMVPVINSSYTLWVNGKRMLNTGMVGVNSRLSVPGIRPPTVVSFTTNTGEASIVFQVSNYILRRGGPCQYILLGKGNEVTSSREVNIIFSSMGMISVFLIVLFLLFLDTKYWKYHREIFSVLLFIAIGIRISVSDSFLLLHLFPGMKSEIIYKLRYLFTYCIGPLVLLMISRQFKKERSFFIVYGLTGIFFILAAIIVFFRSHIYSSLSFVFDIYQFFCFVYIGFILYKAAKKKRTLYVLEIVEVSFFFLLFINIRLFMLGYITSREVSLSAVVNLIFGDMFSHSSNPFFIFFSFGMYFLIFIFYFFSKIDHLIMSLKEDHSEIPSEHLTLFHKYGLTDRECEIVRAVIDGYSNYEISEKCFISIGTVKNHLSHIYRKTNCANRNKLISLFMSHDDI